MEYTIEWRSPIKLINFPEDSSTAISGVYLWIYRDPKTKQDHVVYVGESGNIRKRVSTELIYALGGSWGICKDMKGEDHPYAATEPVQLSETTRINALQNSPEVLIDHLRETIEYLKCCQILIGSLDSGDEWTRKALEGGIILALCKEHDIGNYRSKRNTYIGWISKYAEEHKHVMRFEGPGADVAKALLKSALSAVYLYAE